jgi:N-acetyl-gamma-glutamylphosphate reductase
MAIKEIKAGIIGATGYAGVELVRLLSGHPHVELAAISSVSFSGEELSKIYPNLRCSVDSNGSNLLFVNHWLSPRILQHKSDYN